MLVGVSGGSDSVALARALLALAPTSDFAVAGLAHFNHRLRDTASRDEILSLFAEIRRELGVTLVLVSHDREIREAAERRIHVRDGRIVEDA